MVFIVAKPLLFLQAHGKVWQLQYPSVVIPVPNIKKHMKIVKDAGGKVLGQPFDIPGYGIYVSFIDTEGNRIGMMQPRMGKD